MLPKPPLLRFQSLLNALNLMGFLLLTLVLQGANIELIHRDHNRSDELLNIQDLNVSLALLPAVTHLVIERHYPSIGYRDVVLCLFLGIHLDRWANLGRSDS